MSQTDDADGRARNTDRDWKRTLTPDQYRVLREEGTERAFSSALNALLWQIARSRPCSRRF